MSSPIQIAITTYREEGVAGLVRETASFLVRLLHPVNVYDDQVRPHLPRRETTYNGVTVRARRVGDGVIPWRHVELPRYETALVAAIRKRVEAGDNVVVVGGGWGVSSVAAANRGAATVRTYEGAEKYVTYIRETAALNGVADRIDVTHAVVGDVENLEAPPAGAARLSPSDLPDCDVLVLDSEGAEIGILERMTLDPRVAIVESHGSFGAPSETVRELVEGRSYRIVADELAEEGVRTDIVRSCSENDIRVLTGVAESQ